MVSKSHATGPIFASLILACLSSIASIEPAVAEEPACLATERQSICTCDLTRTYLKIVGCCRSAIKAE